MATKLMIAGSNLFRQPPTSVGSISRINRWTGKAHNDKRAIERRLIQKGKQLFSQDIRDIALRK